MRKRKPKRQPGRYCGLTLAEWRGSIRAIQRSGWWVFDTIRHDSRLGEQLHHAVLVSATMLLPVEWHREHEGRLSDTYYQARRAYVDKWGDPARLRPKSG